MAQIVKIASNNPQSREVITLVANLRDVLRNAPSVNDRMSQAIGVSVAEFATMYGITNATEAQALYDRVNALDAWVKGTADPAPTAAQVLANIQDLVNAFFPE